VGMTAAVPATSSARRRTDFHCACASSWVCAGPIRSGRPDAAEEHRAAGEQGQVCAIDVDGKAHVIGSVAGGVDDPDETGIAGQLVSILDPASAEIYLHAVGDDVLRVEDPGKLQASADIVIVEVGFQNV